MALPEGLFISPALVMGLIIGLVELFFVHRDERGMGMAWIGHGLHTIPFAIIFVFISMNVQFVLDLVGLSGLGGGLVVLGVRVLVAIVAMAKIAGAAAIAPGAKGIGEKLPHTLIIGALVFAAPYMWDMFLRDIIAPHLPF
jgi:hypothetical protein